MKKLWLPLVIVVIWLVVFVAGPWYAGDKVEARLDGLLKRMNTNGLITFEKTAYDKGLFSATTAIKASINFDALGPAAKNLQLSNTNSSFVLNGKVSHGPFLFDDGFAFAVGNISFQPEISAEHQQEVSKFFGSSNPLALNMRFNWDSSTEIGSSLIGFTAPDKTIKSAPATFGATLSNNNTHVKSHFNWGGLSFEKTESNGKAKKATVGVISSSSEEDMMIEDIWVGNSRFNISSITFSDDAMGMSGKADNFNVVAATSLDATKAFMNIMVDMTLKNVTVNNVSYVDDFQYKLSFDHLHAASLQKLVKAIKEAQQAGGSPEAMQMAMGMQLMGIVPDMVKKGFTLRIDALNARVMGEQINSSLELNIAEGTDVTQGMAAIAGISAKLDITVSRALLDKIPMANPQMVQGLISQGLIVEEAGTLKSHAEFKGGQLTVNGKAMPIPGMPMPQH